MKQAANTATNLLYHAVILVSICLLSACGRSENYREKDDLPSRQQQASRVNTELGAGYLRRGNYELALDKLQKAIAYNPENAEAHSTLAILYEQIKRQDEAHKHHRLAIKIDPENAAAQNNYGAFLCKIGEYQNSEKHFLQAAANPFYQTPQMALINAGRCIAKLPAYAKAEEHLRDALAIEPENPEALFLLATIKYELQEYMSARGFLQRYEAVAEPSRSGLILGYRIESALNNNDQQEIYSRKLESLYPGSTVILENQGS